MRFTILYKAVRESLKWYTLIGIYIVLFFVIFDAYYTSPLVRGTTPIPMNITPPATHVIFIVLDGMRADILFRPSMDDTPFIRNILLNEGAWGISQTHAPTESRPGHVALFAGFYEDPSALLEGWKSNPVEFDSLFNRSHKAWARAVPSVMKALQLDGLPHVHSEIAYGADPLDTDGRTVDSFVLALEEKPNGFFARLPDLTNSSSFQHNPTLAFVHLNSADEFGLQGNSKSSKYRALLRQLDAYISKVVDKVKQMTENRDTRVAFILTSDHGMMDSDSHGGDSLHETLTPLLVWGAGLRGPTYSNTSGIADSMDSYGYPITIQSREKQNVQQIDLCPLVASLLGIPIPINSRGRVPLHLMTISDALKVKVIRANCLQLLAQLRVELEEKKRTHFSLFLKEYSLLTQREAEGRLRKAESFEKIRAYSQTIEQYSELEQLLINALRYYHTYDRKFYCVFVAITTFLWSVEILCHLIDTAQPGESAYPKPRFLKIIRLLLIVYGMAVIIHVFNWPVSQVALQIVPLILALHLVSSPNRTEKLVKLSNRVLKHIPWNIGHMKTRDLIGSSYTVVEALVRILVVVCILEFLMLGFTSRSWLSLACIFVALWPFFDPSFGKGRAKLRILWTLTCILLAIFPLLPVFTSLVHPVLVCFTGLIMSGLSAVCLRSLSRFAQLQREVRSGAITFGYVMSILVALASVIVVVLRLFTSISLFLSQACYLFAWGSLALPAITFILVPKRLGLRAFYGINALLIPYILLSLGYEVLFFGVLIGMGILWIQMEMPNASSHELWLIETTTNRTFTLENNPITFRTCRPALFLLFFIVLSFFGISDIATYNTFDKRIPLCFVAWLDRDWIPFFVTLKVLPPVVCIGLLASALQAAGNHFTSSQVSMWQAIVTQGGLCTIGSNFFVAHFFTWIRDEGSWLAIGSSIVHYGIAMAIGPLSFVALCFGWGILCLGLNEQPSHGRRSVQRENRRTLQL